jgi:hypothetical protein
MTKKKPPIFLGPSMWERQWKMLEIVEMNDKDNGQK